MIILGSPFAFRAGTMLAAIQRVGATTSLQLCLDASDIDSYAGSGQTWLDTSGNSNNFYRGAGSGSASNDPTFNGVAGGQSASEYFSSDGGDAFWNTANHSFPANWHKNGATVTVAAWMFIPSGSTETTFILSNVYDGSIDRGVSVFVNPSTDKMFYQIAWAGAALQTFTTSASGYITTNQWMFAAISFSEESGESFVLVDGTVYLLSGDTFSSPSASGPTKGMAIWSPPNASNTGPDSDTAFLPDNGSRINSVAAWNRALSQSEVGGIYQATRAKFGA